MRNIYIQETFGIQAEAMEKKKAKKEKGKAAFGWDIFNQDSLYKGCSCFNPASHL